ncbi:hypothetical protein GOEFS_096_00910 [Gordonia effusa NBRC 100432]|uniref:Uncharacterized protein n=1 Tax=Gordonia effusa NBRC 100432 TaxID=1077974 RepID=H0R4B3_9ACTN|nr:hypothetical protein [Gordonia effusa]GAB19914.1 hypothetical protein GOEFS_096_00910 [Gordonia effusa NBRC 100432]
MTDAWPNDPASGPNFASNPGFPQPRGTEQPLVSIGEITCTQSYVITPSGTFPTAGAQWTVADMSMTTERISQTGLVLALVGFFLICAFSLFFLLMKDRQTVGYIQVMVRGVNGMTYVANIPARSPATMMDISNRVNYARALA